MKNAAVLRLPQVLTYTGVTKGTIYRWVQLGIFPSPVRLGQQAVGWKSADVDAWLASRQPTVPRTEREAA